MKRLTLTLAVVVMCGFVAQAANLADADKQFLAGYEKVRAALAADDLAASKTAAAALGDNAAPVAKAGSLKEAREGFEKLSARAKSVAAGQPGYYVVHCPMLKKDWVQTSSTVSNPYAGKAMLSCGEVKK